MNVIITLKMMMVPRYRNTHTNTHLGTLSGVISVVVVVVVILLPSIVLRNRKGKLGKLLVIYLPELYCRQCQNYVNTMDETLF